MKHLAPILAAACLIAAAFGQSDQPLVQRNSDGVTIRLANGTLGLQVYADDTIRVRFRSPESGKDAGVPVIVGSPKPVRWRLTTSPSLVQLRTSRLTAEVNRKTGTIRFLDAEGKSLLSELPTERLRPVSTAGFHTQASTERFALRPGEAIFGLGQHQQGVMDYVGTRVPLLQQNREIAVPMMVSSCGYGILWNNPAVTNVDVAGSDERVVQPSMLLDEEGVPGGLTGRYYEGQSFGKLVATRRDANIDFNWSQTPPPGLGHDHYSVRWTGYLQAPVTGDYTLVSSGDDGIRLTLDDKVVSEDWNSRALVSLYHKVRLQAGRRYKLRFEFYQDTYDSVVRFATMIPPKEKVLTWSSEAGSGVDYVFFYGPNLERVLASYRELTGQAPMFGRWAWGLWQSRERYASQQELLDVVAKYRGAKIPLDGIIQDWQYWSPGQWGSHVFDPVRYPDPATMMRRLHEDHIHALISVWPKFDVGIENDKELLASGGMIDKVIPYVFPEGKGRWYDPFSAAGRKTYWSQIERNLAKPGLDGWWLDGSEAEFSGNWGEFRDFQTAMGRGALVFNAYPLMHTTAVYQGQRASTDEKRVLILTRSAYAGQQRNAAVSWSGDIDASWAALQKQVPAGINFSLSGIPYWNTDTGGFFANAPVTSPDYQDLFARWFQYSTFVPMLRIHGTGTAKEIWRWPEPTRSNLIAFDRLRYHLLPYIYSTAWQVTSKGSSMLRGLVLDFREDEKVYGLRDEYMFGPQLLVAPVTTPRATTREVYLPKGASWIDFWTGQRYGGGRRLQAEAVAKIPVYVRAGSILPYGPDVQSAEEPCDPLDIRVYPGSDASFTLYDDEGDGYGYEKGAYATTDFQWNEREGRLSIGARRGKYPGMVKLRTFRIVLVDPTSGAGISVAGKAGKVVRYSGERVDLSLRPSFPKR